jgi:Tfp pilus assembly protein PilV
MHTHPSKKGFTLPEVVITGLLMVMVMLPITRLAYSVARSTRYARDVGTAIAIGQEQLEQLADLAYTEIADGSTTVDGFAVSWTVTEADLSKVVRMTIQWSILGKPMEATMNTVYTSNIAGGFSFQ